MDSEALTMIVVMPTMFLIVGYGFKGLLNFFQQRQLVFLARQLGSVRLAFCSNVARLLDASPRFSDLSDWRTRDFGEFRTQSRFILLDPLSLSVVMPLERIDLSDQIHQFTMESQPVEHGVQPLRLDTAGLP